MKMTLDEAMEKAGDFAQSGIAKSAQVAEMAKLQVNNMGEQDALKKLYLELGKFYYEQYKQKPDYNVMAVFKRIDDTLKRIEENNLRIKELRNPDVIFTQGSMPQDAVEVDVEVEGEKNSQESE